MSSTWKTIRRVAAFGLLAFLLSACMKLDMDLKVSADNTVSGTVVFAIQRELVELGGGSVDDLLGSAAPFPSEAEGVTVADYEDDKFVGKKYTFDAIALTEFSNSGADAEQLQIVRQGDEFQVSGALDLSSALSGASGATGFDPSTFFDSAEMRIRITFPGEVTSSNGEVDGNSVSWVPVIGERLELQATASAIDNGGGGGSSMTLLLIIGGAVVVLAVVIGIVLAQRRNRPAPAVAGYGEAAPPPPPAAGGTPPPPPPGPPGQP